MSFDSVALITGITIFINLLGKFNNRKMNKPSIRIIAFIFAGTILFMSSCELDDFNLDSNDDRDKIVDTWKCEENSSLFGQQTPYLSDISKSSSDSVTIYINNFYQLGFNEEIFATLTNRSIDIPNQTVDGHVIIGFGTVASNYNSIQFTYTVDDGSGMLDNVNATYRRN